MADLPDFAETPEFVEALKRANAILDEYASDCRAVAPYQPASVDRRRLGLARDVVALHAAWEAVTAERDAAQDRYENLREAKFLEACDECNDREEAERTRADRLAGHVTALREALEDEISMAEQTIGTLRDLHANWEKIIEERDPDGGPLIENILYWLIEDVKPDAFREALAEPLLQTLADARHASGASESKSDGGSRRDEA